MSKFALIISVFLSLNVFAAKTEHAPAAGHKGANLDLFPTPTPDATKAVRPGKVTLAEPAYRAVVSGDTVTLKWSTVPTADAYHVQVATDSAFKWIVSENGLVKQASFEVKGLQKGTQYFWRVAAVKTNNHPTFTKGWFSSSAFVAQ